VRLFAPYPVGGSVPTTSRLWLAALSIPMPLADYLARHGSPIRYRYVPERWPLEMYQTVFANEPGSAEMPSAGRPFSTELVTQLVSSGVRIAPILLHTGVASLEDHEPPYEEFYRVSRETADTVNLARRSGRRVVAVGTTAVRALETVADADGTVSPGEGWTTVVISPTRPTRCIDAVVTGLHEPQATHLLLLEQVVAAAQRRRPAPAHRRRDAGLLREAYDEAVERRYLWHEFGDSHLII
jgi:S-adenosylmethionine:tRNA ribosyltransferase-isomerase